MLSSTLLRTKELIQRPITREVPKNEHPWLWLTQFFFIRYQMKNEPCNTVKEKNVVAELESYVARLPFITA